MRALLREAATEYNFVILDSPPLLKQPNARILASAVDTTILVVKGGDTPRQVVQYADRKPRRWAQISGVVLNNLNFHSNGDSVLCHGYYNTTATGNSVDDCAPPGKGLPRGLRMIFSRANIALSPLAWPFNSAVDHRSLTARILGPAARGELATVMLWPMILSNLGLLGCNWAWPRVAS